jgi:plastocyanin domain-containing protein
MKVIVEFDFDVDETKTKKQIKDCIKKQILSDLNAYWQNDDDTAQMKSVGIKMED